MAKKKKKKKPDGGGGGAGAGGHDDDDDGNGDDGNSEGTSAVPVADAIIGLLDLCEFYDKNNETDGATGKHRLIQLLQQLRSLLLLSSRGGDRNSEFLAGGSSDEEEHRYGDHFSADEYNDDDDVAAVEYYLRQQRQQRKKESESELLLQIETTLSKLRDAARVCRRRSFPDDLSETLVLLREIEEKASFQSAGGAGGDSSAKAESSSYTTRWRLVGRGVAMALQRQIHQELRIVDKLENEVFDCVYDGFYSERTIPNNNAIEMLDSALRGFDRKSAIRRQRYDGGSGLQYDLTELSDLVLRLRTGRRRRDGEDRGTENRMQELQLLESVFLDDAQLEVAEPTRRSFFFDCCYPDIVVRESSVLGAIRAFLEADSKKKIMLVDDVGDHEFRSSAAFLLVVGPEGSGKTHICDMAECAAKETSTTGAWRSPLPCRPMQITRLHIALLHILSLFVVPDSLLFCSHSTTFTG